MNMNDLNTCECGWHKGKLVTPLAQQIANANHDVYHRDWSKARAIRDLEAVIANAANLLEDGKQGNAHLLLRGALLGSR